MAIYPIVAETFHSKPQICHLMVVLEFGKHLGTMTVRQKMMVVHPAVVQIF